MVILELIHAASPDFLEGMYLLDTKAMQLQLVPSKAKYCPKIDSEQVK